MPGDVVSDLFLQLDCATDGVPATAAPIFVGFRAIKLLEIISTTGTLLQCTGEQLGQYLIWFNRKFGHDTTNLLKLLVDNGITTGSSVSAATLCVPLIGPGSR